MDYKKFLDQFRTNTKTPHCSAVILAAGNSTRMGKDKSVLSLGGIPVIIRSIQAFEQHELVDEIIVVTREEAIQPIADLCVQYNGAMAAVLAYYGFDVYMVKGWVYPETKSGQHYWTEVMIDGKRY